MRDLERFQRRAAWVLGALGGALLAGLMVRLVSIQSNQAPKLNALMAAQQQSAMVIPARRGSIFDVRGRVVAGSRQLYGVFVDPGQIESAEAREQTAARLGAILGMDAGEIEEAIRRSGAPRFCWIKHRIAPEESEAVRQAGLPGVGLVEEPVRHYPLGASMAHVLGFVGSDGQGLEGLELTSDSWLRGRDGQVWTVRDSRRRVLREAAEDGRDREQPQDGGHIVLTIDSVIQAIVEEQLPRQVQEFEARSAVGIVMDPKTGEVLAMACYPAFDPNDYGAASADLRRNRVITDMVEPGSTFKPFVAAGALGAGVVSLGQMIDCHDGLYVTGGRRLHDASPHGVMPFEEVVSRSSNIGMAIIGERMGNPLLHETIRRFGFGEPTGIDLPGEADGGVLPLKRWTRYSTTSVPMGHEVAVTPMQLIAAFCAILNDGVYLRPRVVRARLSPEGEVLEEFTGPEPIRRVLSSATAQRFARDVLVRVVNEGTGKRAALRGYQVLGKTGTAQVPYKNRRGYEPDAYVGSFIGAAPAEDPRVAVLVMVHHPNARKGYYGGTVAAPAAREILAGTLAYMQVPPRGVMTAGIETRN